MGIALAKDRESSVSSWRDVDATAALPGPLHMSGALLGYRHLSIPERIRLIAGGSRMMYMRSREHDRLRRMSVAELLAVLKQGERARPCFW